MRKKLKLDRQTVRLMTVTVRGLKTTELMAVGGGYWPDPPPPTGTSCHCAPSPTNSCDGCTMTTFGVGQ